MRKALVSTATVVLLVVAGWFGVTHLPAVLASGRTVSSAPACPAVAPATVGRFVVPAGPVAGFCQPQLIMAAHIMNAARDQGLGTRTQAVGVMTAIGESGLVNLDHGDAAGPDSRGLFQQRDNGAWGTLAERMDPYSAASHFFAKLTTVDGWQTMPPSQLAHAVQVNADAGYYDQYWDRGQAIVAALDAAASPTAP